MRIVGGSLRGRTLPGRLPPATRPTADRVREAIASALAARDLIAGARVLDLFAGTGALGLEALSRGAHSLVAADKDPRAVACVRENAAALELTGQVRTLAIDLFAPPAKVAATLERCAEAPFSLVFADPPYTQVDAAAQLIGALAERGLFAPGCALVFEHARKQPPALPSRMHELASYTYGDTGVLLWETIASESES